MWSETRFQESILSVHELNSSVLRGIESFDEKEFQNIVKKMMMKEWTEIK